MKVWKTAALLLMLFLLIAGCALAEGQEPVVLTDGFAVPAFYKRNTIDTPSGKIACDQPFYKVTASVFNERTLEYDVTASVDLSAEPVTKYSAQDLLKKLHLYNLPSGEKTLYVDITGDFGTVRAVERPFCVAGAVKDPVSMTGDCVIRDSNGREIPALINRYFVRGWVNTSGKDYVVIRLPKGRTAEGLYMQWDKPPEDYTVVALDAEGNKVLSLNSTNPYQFYNIYEEIPETAVEIRLTTASTTNMLCRVYVFETGRVPSVVQRWQPLPEDVDLMFIGAHKNDETVFFSGSIPLTIAQGRTVAVVCMTEYQTRAGDEEYFEALWALGVRYHPIMLRKWDGKKPMDQMEEIWGGYDKVCGELVYLMRRYKPEVVLTHDIDGENGHIQHILTTRLVIDAVERCPDEEWYEDSLERFGAWDVKKLYLHLYDESKRLHLPFDEPLDYYGGRTAMDMAYTSFDKHQSQIESSSHYSLDVLGRWHDKTFFGLYRSTVGDDVEKNDFFEHID